MVAIILLLLRRKNIYKFYYTFLLLIISTVLQELFFISNINETSLENIDKDILVILNDTLPIPFYKKYLGKDNYIENGILLGGGINHSQLLLIWNENILLFLIYIYLYYFCFNIFNKNDEKPSEDNNKNKLQVKLNGNIDNDNQLIINDNIEN